MASSIQIGTTLENLAPIDALFESPRDREPRPMAMTYSRNLERGDGTRLQGGWRKQVWHWDFLSEGMTDNLRALIGPVYVITRNNDSTYSTYSAVLVWPEEEPEHFAGRVLDLSIELRKLVAVSA